MTPERFIAKWKIAELKESSAAQSHFIDLCRVLDEPAPTDVDPKGEWYAFERGATKTTGGEGWADVWKRGHFGWEYKGKRKDLDAAFAQLQQYALALENPPLLVVCDLDRFRIRTNWTNSVSELHEFALDDLRDGAIRQKLKWTLSDPERLRPGKTRQALTEEAASEFAKLAQRLRDQGHSSENVAHFINRIVFCMFAEDVDLLPSSMFKRMLEHSLARPEEFATLASDLFLAMRAGGRVGFERVEWFNGGLFNDDAALPMDKDDIALTLRAANLDWAEIDPSILGTLFERGLDPDKRSQLGAHYTDRDKIMMIVEPVIIRPLTREWESVRESIKGALEPAERAIEEAIATASNYPELSEEVRAVQSRLAVRPQLELFEDLRRQRRIRTLDAVRAALRAAEKALSDARAEGYAAFNAFMARLRAFRVLDPACGSGNFLYLALLGLKDIEHRAGIEAEAMGLQRAFPQIGPASVLGIEINPYAAELARVSVWIGEIQWMRRNGFDVSRNPILKPLDTIECRDAILSADATEATWPDADVVIGNPPFLGDNSMLGTLGVAYVGQLRGLFVDRLSGGVDLVTYWFEKARALIEAGKIERAGLVSTQAIRRGSNRAVLDGIKLVGRIFDAWSDEPWVVEGAAVRVSLVCFGRDPPEITSLNGVPVTEVYADLSSGDTDLTLAKRLQENAGVCFQGPVKVGPFDVEGDVARRWLLLPLNPNGRPNSDVLRPWLNGQDMAGRPSDTWIVDFAEMPENQAALYQAPFEYARDHVKPMRDRNNRERRRRIWWQHGETVPGLRRKVSGMSRVIATPRVSKHRFFSWMSTKVLPDSRVNAIARDDDTTFGVLHSRFHQSWTLAKCSWHGDGSDGGRPTYTSAECFETFPFPEGLTPNLLAEDYRQEPHAVKIANAAKHLDDRREAWLNPSDLVKREPEVAPGFPDRILPVNDESAAILKKRTLTKLYNERPVWLANAHRDLDAAVAGAYGWPAEISDDEVLARLFALNQSRAESS